MNIPGYDEWRLSGPDEYPEIGTEDGQTCNRLPEPDEDAPRHWRPRRRRCAGTMVLTDDECACDTCGETK